jgi:FkbM family methyltransferase
VKTKVARSLRAIIRTFGLDVVRYSPRPPGHELLAAINCFASLRDIADARRSDEEIQFIEFCGRNWRKSRSQLFQDLFVQFELGEKTGGYFVEFGAADGVHLSNTYSLEKDYKWQGILSEPALCWQAALKVNRSCHLELRCVWDESDASVNFSEVDAAELSTVSTFTGTEGALHAATRRHSHVYRVNTVTLGDMLRDFNAPTEIDYLSIDTEGSELKILTAFDFTMHTVKIITVEHNYTSDREKLHELLTRNGYRRKFELFSRWDDWYVLNPTARHA